MKLLFQLAVPILAPLLIVQPIRAEMQSSDAAAPQIHISVVDRDGDTAMSGSETRKGFTVLVADAAGSPVSESAVVFRLPDEGPSGSFSDSSHSAIVYTGADGLARIAGIKWNDTAGPVVIKVTATRGDARAGILLAETIMLSTPTPPISSAGPLPPPIAPETAPVAQPAVSVVQKKEPLPRPIAAAAESSATPAVSVVNSKGAAASSHSSHKKWIILAAVVAAAAGAGIAMTSSKGKSSSSSTSTTGVSVGTPTVSVGAP